MIPYFVVFFLSILLCGGGEWMLRRSRLASGVLFGACLVPPVFLAGARDYAVGTDITTYGNYVFTAAGSAKRLLPFLRTRREIELLYKALAWFVSRFTNNPHWFYFVTALIICGCTLGGLFYYRRWCSVTLGWACFLFLFYGDTLNTMRQCLALAVVFVSFPLFLEKRYGWFAFFQAAAILFHVTGVIALSLPVLYLFLRKVPPRWVQFFFIIGCMGVILFYSPLLRVVLQTGLLPAKFSRYLARGVAFAMNPTILRLPFLLPVILYYDRFCGFEGGDAADPAAVPLAEGAPGAVSPAPAGTSSGDGAVAAGAPFGTAAPEAGAGITPVTGMFIVILLLLEICTVQLRSVQSALYRISYYFGYYRFLAYARLVRILRRDNRALVALALLAYLCVLWYYQNVVQGNNQIYPYIYAPRWFWQTIPVMPAQ